MATVSFSHSISRHLNHHHHHQAMNCDVAGARRAAYQKLTQHTKAPQKRLHCYTGTLISGIRLRELLSRGDPRAA